MKKKTFSDIEDKLKKILGTKIDRDQRQKIIICSDSMHFIIELNTIIRLEGIGNYTQLYLTDGRRITSSKTLKIYHDLLMGTCFFRVYRSHIINLNYVASFTTSLKPVVIMTDGAELEISREKKKEFFDLMGLV